MTPGSAGTKGAIDKAHEIAKEAGGWRLCNLTIQLIQKIHELTTGPEILEAFGSHGLDAVVAGIGTGGTITGDFTCPLKKTILDIKIYGLKLMNLLFCQVTNRGPIKTKASQQAFIPAALDTHSMMKLIRVKSDDAFCYWSLLRR